jgi:uncharacterized membrane protein
VAKRIADIGLTGDCVGSMIFLSICFLAGYFTMNFNWMRSGSTTSGVLLALGVVLPSASAGPTVIWLWRKGRAMKRQNRWRPNERVNRPGWVISAAYAVASIVLGLILPRLESVYFPSLAHGMSVSAALAFFSAVSSGMMALTGIVFAVAFVLVQFGASSYSPRLVVMFTNNPRLYHALGIFFATFCYSLAALAWTDRGGSGVVPLFSTMLVGALVIASMFAFVGMVNSLNDMQIHNVLRGVGNHGRQVIAEMYQPFAQDGDERKVSSAGRPASFGPVTQTITYMGEPRSIAKFDTAALVRLAESIGGMIELDYAVGDTALRGTTFARVRGVSDDAAHACRSAWSSRRTEVPDRWRSSGSTIGWRHPPSRW